MSPGLSPCIEALDAILKGPLSGYLIHSRAVGTDVEKHVRLTDLLMKCLLTSEQEFGAKNDNIPVLSWKSGMNTSVVISASQDQRITAQVFDSLCVKAAWR